jgi:hypothetical protein
MHAMKYGNQFITAFLDSMDVIRQLNKQYPNEVLDLRYT